MKTFRLLIGACSLLLLFSCGNKPNDKGEFIMEKPNGQGEVRIKFYNDGKIEYIQEVKNDAPEGFFINFSKNGNPKSTSVIVNGKKEGTGIVFYPNGTVNNLGTYINDEKTGFFWIWDKKANLVEKREYVTVKGKNQMNQWLKLDEHLQPVTAESNYISLQADKDTITSGESYNLTVSLDASYKDAYMAMIIGPFDEQYNLPAGSKCDTLIGKNFVAVYKTTQYKTGNNTLRGVVKDISVSEDMESTSARNIYFTKEFLVRK